MRDIIRLVIDIKGFSRAPHVTEEEEAEAVANMVHNKLVVALHTDWDDIKVRPLL